MKMKKSKNILQDIINNDSLNLFTMLSGYFLLVLIIYTFFKLLNFKNCLGIVQAISIITPIVI